MSIISRSLNHELKDIHQSKAAHQTPFHEEKQKQKGDSPFSPSLAPFKAQFDIMHRNASRAGETGGDQEGTVLPGPDKCRFLGETTTDPIRLKMDSFRKIVGELR